MMKLFSIRLFALAAVTAGGLSLPVYAQQTASPAAQTREPPPIPVTTPAQVEEKAVAPSTSQAEGKGWLPAGGSVQIKTSDTGIRYASGGVGESEREELRAMSNQFNLRVMSAMQGGGEFLADVQVNILDSKGATVLSATSKGPFFLAQLPNGNYTIEAVADGKTQKQSIQVGNSQAQVNFYWK